MDTTSHLGLPYILPSQAQKHVTHNEALRLLDALVQLSVDATGVTAEPADARDGTRVLLGPDAGGVFAGRDEGVLACHVDGGWLFVVPQPGWTCFDRDAGTMLVMTADGWRPLTAQTPPPEILPRLGIATGADDVNRLSVSSPATLLSHAGASHRLTINKAGAADTASLLFQSAWTGHAEMGLAGSDGFSLKVSADGASWREALRTDPATGRVAFPYGADGVVETLSVGTVTTGPAGSAAQVIRRGTAADPILDFTLPRGDKGESAVPPTWRNRRFAGSGWTTHVAGGSAVAQGTTLKWLAVLIGRADTIDALTVYCQAGEAGARLRCALYAGAEDNGPGLRLAQWPEIDLSTAGAKTATLASPVSLTPGLYWIASQCSSSVPTFRGGSDVMPSGSGLLVGAFMRDTGLMETSDPSFTFPLPADATAWPANTTANPGLRIVSLVAANHLVFKA